ncbi:hypothetical protein TWF694_001424 [Orbilia ellipsospora]|uniref:N-acetyltransferase domain-containing protein n=1 Tax=Orbilia ellipsospora TaxID=2528407 RepID=A0AAV9XU42_9PEZI
MSPTELPNNLHIGYASDFPPELFSNPANWQGFDDCWPKYFDLDDIGISELLCEDPWLRQFQITVVHKEPNSPTMRFIATGHTVPFYWSEPQDNNSLPDGGWNAVRSLAMKQYYFRNKMPEKIDGFKECSPPDIPDETTWDVKYNDHTEPNVLCAMSICILPEFRKLGLAERIIGLMRDKCIAERYEAFVAPVRPTRKTDFKEMEMSTYLQMGRNGQLGGDHYGTTLRSEDIFDPWIRKHVSIGGVPVKIANNSMVFRGNAEAWDGCADKPGMCGKARREGKVQRNKHNNEEYVNIYDVPGTLGPVRYYPRTDEGVYREANVWIRHI